MEGLPMPSPFPGMDPYIEACGLWGDFAHSLICGIAEKLSDDLPEEYAPRIGSREYTAICYSEEECVYPAPSHVSRAPHLRRAVPVDDDGPRTIRAFIAEQNQEYYLNILKFDPRPRTVTRIEVLTPANKKRGYKGRELYERKRR